MNKKIKEFIEINNTELIRNYIEENKIENIVTFDGESDDRLWMWEGIKSYFDIDIMIYSDTDLTDCINTVTDANSVDWCDNIEVYETFEKKFLKKNIEPEEDFEKMNTQRLTKKRCKNIIRMFYDNNISINLQPGCTALRHICLENYIDSDKYGENIEENFWNNLKKWNWIEDRGMFVLTSLGYSKI